MAPSTTHSITPQNNPKPILESPLAMPIYFSLVAFFLLRSLHATAPTNAVEQDVIEVKQQYLRRQTARTKEIKKKNARCRSGRTELTTPRQLAPSEPSYYKGTDAGINFTARSQFDRTGRIIACFGQLRRTPRPARVSRFFSHGPTSPTRPQIDDSRTGR